MRQSIHDTNKSYIESCAIVIVIFYIGGTGSLVDGIHYLEPQEKCPLRHHKACAITSLFGWGRWHNCGTLIIAVFLC